MADLQTALVGEPDVRLLTITVDPKRDTPERLTEYAKQFQADPQRWLFVTGERQAIYDLSAKGFKLGTIVEADEVATTDHPILHSTKMALVDWEGQIRGYYDGTSSEDVDRLKADAVRLAVEKQ
jgi:protein SCO1/2